jgi:hypothetical protein
MTGARRVIAGPSPGRLAPDLPRSGDGCRVACAHCRREFKSIGLRCCSAECERKLIAAQALRAENAASGVESTGYVPRTCENCGKRLPRWIKGRALAANQRFCCRSCAEKAGRRIRRQNSADAV